MNMPQQPTDPHPPAATAGPWQFTLGGLFMFVTLVAILLTFLRAEGCGRSFTKIGSVEFSPDGKRLVVARYNARDANVSMKAWWSDVSRTISIVNVESGTVERVLEQTTKPGNQGPALVIYLELAGSIAFGQDADTLFVVEHGGGKISRFDLITGERREVLVPPVKSPLPIPPGQPVRSLAISNDRRLLALGYPYGIALWDLQSEKSVRTIFTGGMSSVADKMAFSYDNSTIATIGWGDLRFWNVSNGAAVGPPSGLPEPSYDPKIAYSPKDGKLAITTGEELRVYEGGKMKFLSHVGAWAATFSPDGKKSCRRYRQVLCPSGLGDGQVVRDQMRRREHRLACVLARRQDVGHGRLCRKGHALEPRQGQRADDH
jgi:WD40 repeat protein